jgi:putative salt-induced outer membrane protein YdiY
MKTLNTTQNDQSWRLGVAAALLMGCGLTSAHAQAVVPAASTNHWETTAAAAVTLTGGNSESLMATIGLDTKRKWEHDEVAFNLSGGYGESKVNDVTTTNTKFIQGFGQYDHLFTDRLYAGFRLDGQYDGIAGVDYRIKATPLAGYYLIKNDKMILAVEAGPSAVFEQLQGEAANDYWAIRFGERFEYKLTSTTRVWETLGYTAQVDAWADNFLVNAEVGIDTAIDKHWSLRVVFQDLYASAPAPGKKNNDVRLLAGTAYKF